MRSFLFSVTLTLLAMTSSFGQTKDVEVLKEAVKKVVAETKDSVACILVSRSERYGELGAPISSIPGKLGGFDPLIKGDETRRALIRRHDLADPGHVPESYGSGVVIDSSGLILTQYHVVQNATKVYVRLPDKKGSYADIFAADSRSDLAVLKLLDPPRGLNAIRFCDGQKMNPGDFVIGFANPYNSSFRSGGSVASYGIISDLRIGPQSGEPTSPSRSLAQLRVLMRTDIRLNAGCSGGAIMNLRGEMVGLTTAIAAIGGGDAPGGYALPLDANIKRMIEVLKKGEEVEYGFLGVSFDFQQPDGVVIGRVADGTPARRAGLMAGDKIIAVNDVRVKDYDDLQLNIGTALAGSEVDIWLADFAKPRKVKVKLAKWRFPGPFIAANRRPPVFGLHIDYSSVIDSDIAIPEGVAIRELEKGSPAENKLKDLLDRNRLVVTGVNGRAVSSPAEFYVETNKAKRSLELRIVEVVRNPESTARIITLP